MLERQIDQAERRAVMRNDLKVREEQERVSAECQRPLQLRKVSLFAGLPQLSEH